MKKNSKEDIPEITEKTYIHKGFFDLRIDTVHKKTKPPANYTILLTKAKAVAVLAKDICGRYLIIKEYRYPVQKWVYSLPGGRVDPNESPKKAAQRELLEETGYTAKSLDKLCLYNPMPSVCDQEIDIFYCKECEKIATQHLDPLEVIEPMLLKEKELFSLIQENSQEVDGILSSALFYLLVSKRSC